MNEEKVHAILRNHVPEKSVDYCFGLWKERPFDLKITRTRQSKVGDFTGRKDARYQKITLNHELNPYLFLVTYIHEFAHLLIYSKYGDKVDPHGEQWKNAFRYVMIPLLRPRLCHHGIHR